MSTLGRLKKTRIFGKYFFYYLIDDKYIGQRIALGKYESYETELILRQIKKEDVVVDVGANIGYYTVILAKKCKKVYAFEPDKINFEILKKNVEINKLENVILINAAVGSKDEEKILYKSKDNLGDHKLFGEGEKEKVKIIKLDNFVKEKVNLVKIDTQGWEPEIFEGAKNLIGKYKPIIFFEYSPASYKQAKLNGDKMMDFIKKIYKKFWWIDEWLYIYKNLDKEKIDQICGTNKTGYADVWVKKEFNWKDYWRQYRNFKVKSWVKNTFLGR